MGVFSIEDRFRCVVDSVFWILWDVFDMRLEKDRGSSSKLDYFFGFVFDKLSMISIGYE